MATFKITAPDGGTYNITAPDDATPDQVMEFAKAKIGNGGTEEQPKPHRDQSYMAGLARTALGQGTAFGFGDEIAAGARSLIGGESYDDGDGTLGSVGNNQWTVQRVYLFPASGNKVISYGQKLYNSSSAAVQGITTEEFAGNPAFATGILRAFIAVKGNATDLSDNSQAIIVEAGKFGEGASGSSSGSTNTNLQNVYLNSTQPQIILDSTKGGFEIEDASTPIGASLFAVQSSSAAQVFLDVSTTSFDLTVPLIYTSTTLGSIPYPVMTEAQRDAISSPSEGEGVYNSTTDRLSLYDGSAWDDLPTKTDVSAVGKNYISNWDAESNTTGWATFDDASATPVDGTGGSPSTITLSRNTSSALRDVGDFDIAKTAADGQGEGWSYDFTID